MRVQLVTLTRWSMTVCQRRVCGSRSRNRIRMDSGGSQNHEEQNHQEKI
jgi:hypothetical protein